MIISLLGSPQIVIGGQVFAGLRRKNCALVYYIAAHHAPLSRDQILTLFWPDTERSSAQQTLRTMLHDIRNRLGRDNILVEKDRLSLSPEVRVDAREFAAGLKANFSELYSLADTVSLYRADFMDGFTLSDSPEFDEWVESERRNYQSLAIGGYSALSQLQESLGNFSEALETITKALSIDPFREELHRDSLRLRFLSGDRAGAIRHYESLCKLLANELGVPPMPETRAIYDQIISDKTPDFQSRPAASLTNQPETSLSTAKSLPSPALLPFAGRSKEINHFKSQISSPKFILVEGPPGIGKTRLVHEFLAILQANPSSDRMQTLILLGNAHELEQSLPYQPVIDALRGLLSRPDWPLIRASLNLAPVWLTEITRLLPEMQFQFSGLIPAYEAANESRTREGIHQFLENLSHRFQVVLFLDDLHWADLSTIGLIGYLARRLSSSRIHLIGTTRPLDNQARLAIMLKALSHEDLLTHIALAPLTPADTSLIVKSVSPGHPDELSTWLTKNAEGNPFFLAELIRHVFRINSIGAEGQANPNVFAAGYYLPPTIQNLILSRLTHLSEAALRILETAAVIGREFDFNLIYEIIKTSDKPLSEGIVLDALDELQNAVLIQPIGVERFSFDHNLTMEAVLQDLGELRSRRLHRQVALALETIQAENIEPISGIIAHHYSKGGLYSMAAQFAFRAGQYASGLAAWDEAIAYYHQALLAKIGKKQRSVIMIALGSAQFHNGEFAQASNSFTIAVIILRKLNDLAEMEQAYMGLNQSLLPQSRFSEAIAIGQELALSGPPELQICTHFMWAASLSVESSRPDEAEAHMHEIERLMLDHPEYHSTITAAHLKYQMAAIVGQQGRSAQAVSLYLEAEEIIKQSKIELDLLRNIMLFNNLAYHMLLIGHPAASRYAQKGIQLAQERGELTHMPYLLSTSGEIALSNNNLDEAEQLFTEGLQLARQIPINERIAGLTANLGLVEIKRGRDDLARSHLLEALELADRLGVRHLAVRIRCWLAPLLVPAEARIRLEEGRKIAAESGFRLLFNEILQIEQEIALI